MIWWQIILVLLLGALPCMLVAFCMMICMFEMKSSLMLDGEILASLKGLHSILNRIEKSK